MIEQRVITSFTELNNGGHLGRQDKVMVSTSFLWLSQIRYWFDSYKNIDDLAFSIIGNMNRTIFTFNQTKDFNGFAVANG